MAGETYSIKGGSSIQWGVAATSDKGTVLDFAAEDTGKYDPIENAMGAVTGIVIYDTETVIRLTVVALAAATKPVVGDSITADGVTATVLKSSKVAGNKTKVKFQIEANKWANLTLA